MSFKLTAAVLTASVALVAPATAEIVTASVDIDRNVMVSDAWRTWSGPITGSISPSPGNPAGERTTYLWHGFVYDALLSTPIHFVKGDTIDLYIKFDGVIGLDYLLWADGTVYQTPRVTLGLLGDYSHLFDAHSVSVTEFMLNGSVVSRGAPLPAYDASDYKIPVNIEAQQPVNRLEFDTIHVVSEVLDEHFVASYAHQAGMGDPSEHNGLRIGFAAAGISVGTGPYESQFKLDPTITRQRIAVQPVPLPGSLNLYFGALVAAIFGLRARTLRSRR